MFRKVAGVILALMLCACRVFPGRFSEICEWLNVNPSPRGAGLGVSYYGIAQGANASLFNPASPGFIRSREIKAHYGVMLSEMRYSSLAYLEPKTGIGTASLIAQYYTTDDMQEIKEGVLGDEFGNTDVFVSLGLGYPVTEGISLGANIKGFQSSLAGYTAQGFGGDLGVMTLPLKNATFGLAVQNLSSPVKYRDESETLPMALAGGLSYTLSLGSENVDFIFALGGRYMDFDEWETGVGVEHIAMDQFALRVGYQYVNNARELKPLADITAGIGFNISGILIDYSWVPMGEMGYTHRMGLGCRFGPDREKKAKDIAIKCAPAVFSPSTTEMTIKPDWMGIEEIKGWMLVISGSGGATVKEIKGTDIFGEYYWDGQGKDNIIVPDGKYSVILAAASNKGELKSNIEEIEIDNTPPALEVSYSCEKVTPDGDGNDDELVMKLSGSDASMVSSYKITVVNGEGKSVKEFIGEDLNAEVKWDCRDDYYKQIVKNGEYSVIAEAKDIAGNTVVLPAAKINVLATKLGIAEEERGLKINLTSNVLFSANKTTLKEEANESMKEVVALLKTYPDNKVSIEGHSDSVGSNEANKKVSLKRAEAVKAHLVKEGIDEKRLSVVGWGEEKPIASNKTRDGRAQNRRVEIIILKEKMQ
ncbi:MAG: OmpA family protein [Elusimicrobia bacterium]|nr:OmpA family protein [Elusimicrobiota bacterium]